MSCSRDRVQKPAASIRRSGRLAAPGRLQTFTGDSGAPDTLAAPKGRRDIIPLVFALDLAKFGSNQGGFHAQNPVDPVVFRLYAAGREVIRP